MEFWRDKYLLLSHNDVFKLSFFERYLPPVVIFLDFKSPSSMAESAFQKASLQKLDATAENRRNINIDLHYDHGIKENQGKWLNRVYNEMMTISSLSRNLGLYIYSLQISGSENLLCIVMSILRFGKSFDML